MTLDEPAAPPKRTRKAAAKQTGEAWTPLGASADLAAQTNYPTVAMTDRLAVYGGLMTYSTTAVVSGDGGQGWRPVVGEGYFPVNEPSGTAFDGQMWLVGGAGPDPTLAQTASSRDAESWSLRTGDDRWGPRWGHALAGFNGQLHMMAGANSDGLLGDVLRLDRDPATGMLIWNQIGGFEPRLRPAAAAIGGKLLVMGGMGGPVGEPKILAQVLTSPNGADWRSYTPPWAARTDAAAAVLGDTLYLIGGQGARGPLNEVWATQDGRLWTELLWQAPFRGIARHGAAAVDDHIVVAGGNVDGQPNGQAFALRPPPMGWTQLPDDPGVRYVDQPITGRLGGAYWAWGGAWPHVFRSDDGRTWRRITTTGLPQDLTATAGCIHHGKLFISGGHTPSSPAGVNDVYASTDGENWTQVAGAQRFTERPNHCMASFKDRLWVYGPFDVWWSADDGVSWHQVARQTFPHAVTYAKAVVFRDQLWALGGLPWRECWSSPDGTTWTPHTPQWTTRFCFGAVVMGQTLYAVRGVTRDQTVLQEVWATADGVDWELVGTSAPVPGLRQFGTVVVENAIIVFGGFADPGTTVVHQYLPPQLPRPA